MLTHVDNPDGRIKFKDVKKLVFSMCKKDIVATRTEEDILQLLRLILRVQHEDTLEFTSGVHWQIEVREYSPMMSLTRL